MSDERGKAAESLHLAGGIQPNPTPEETAAIVAALESLRGENQPERPPRRSRWEVAGRLGRPLPGGMQIEGSLWPLANRGRSL